MKLNEKKIKEISGKLDILLEKAGQFNKYQFTILILFSFQFILSQFFTTGLFFLGGKPYVKIINNDKNISKSVLLNNSLCNNQTNFILDEKKSTSSILIEFEIYCDRPKTYFLNISLYTGMLFGSFIAYIFADRIGRKKSLLIFIPIHILSLFSFELINKDIFGKAFKNALYLLYFIIFINGFSSRVIMVLIIIYICDIIKQKDIPLFINVILAGTPISEFLSSYIFTFVSLDWKHILSLNAIINIFLYILIIYLIKGSPMFCLNNEDYDNFVKYLMKIGKFNNKSLFKEDFTFLKPYMSSRQKSSIFTIFEENIENEDGNEKDLLYDYDNLDPNKEINSISEELDLKNKSELKKDYLLESKENKNEPYISLFGKLKMKDYSPFDLFKIRQIENFFILSYLWIVSTIVREGFNIYFRSIPKYKDDFIYYFFMVCGEFFGYILIYLIFTKKLTSFHPLLVSLLLSNFLILAFTIDRNDDFTISDFLLLFSIKVITGLENLLILIMTLLIYPVIIRTHGLGGSLTLLSLGNIIALFFDFEMDLKDITLYFLIFIFFALVFSYGLPNRIGSIILAKPYEEEKTEKEENTDISVSLRQCKTFNDIFFEQDDKANKNQNSLIFDDFELNNLKLN